MPTAVLEPPVENKAKKKAKWGIKETEFRLTQHSCEFAEICCGSVPFAIDSLNIKAYCLDIGSAHFLRTDVFPLQVML